MKKSIAVLLVCIFMISALFSCAEGGSVTTGEITDGQETGTTADETTAEPVKEYPSEDDNYAGTPAYTVDGDQIVIDGVSYANSKNITNGVLYAVDDLGRSVTLEGKPLVTDGSRNVGIFYFLWMGMHGDNGIRDNTKIIAEGGEDALKASYKGWGPVGAMHFWGEPLYGYYYSTDKWVMRKHVEELMLAGVDFLYFDVTNAEPYLTNATAIMRIIQSYYDQGFNPPKVIFYTHSNAVYTVSRIYNAIYKTNTCPDAWFYLDGKPLIIAPEKECRSSLAAAAADFFTYREPQWPNEGQKQNGWPWMDFRFPQRVFKNNNKEKEVINVSVAQHCGTIRFSDSAFYGDRTNHGRSFKKNAYVTDEDATLYGYNFQTQWDRAISVDVPYVLVTGWNEWVAQRQPSDSGKNNVVFVDTASMEFSRDIEPMRGGYFDNYYMQLTDNIRKYKGVAPALVQDTRKVIDISGSFDQWDDILVTYSDPVGDCVDRSNLSFGSKRLEDTSGNNDIRDAKITHDTKYMYFYVDVPETVDENANVISAYKADTSWMQLFINTDMSDETGFYGFDYIINNTVKDENTSTVAKCTKDGKEFSFEDSAEISYRVEGNKMMIRVALEDLGISDHTHIAFAFKWVDSDMKITTMEQMYSEGDCAPLGRLCYTFRNYK
ncbi:MAG: hypothetical protein J5879_09075 [Clostridia bacterium]|nr:hypothetical protein [Clostridia bacterium]